MQERVAAESTETAAEPAAVTAAPQGPVVQRMLALQPIKDNDEMWRELGRLATEQTDTGPDGEKRYLYLTNAYTQGVKPGYEDDPVLYTKSVYYSPKEI
jgi:hypothetical protein